MQYHKFLKVASISQAEDTDVVYKAKAPFDRAESVNVQICDRFAEKEKTLKKVTA